MIKFKSPPEVIILPAAHGGNAVKLRRDMVYFVNGRTVTVPKGFRCDGMSVPRCLWSLVSPMIHPQTIAASILHDWLCRTTAHSFTRKQADQFFYFLLLKCKFPRWRAWLAYVGVRLCGAKYWAKGRQK